MMEQYTDLFKAYEDSIKGDTKTGRVNLGTMVWSGRNRTWLDVHKKEEAFLIMCHNTPFLEVFPDHFIIIAPPPDSTHYTNSMNAILNAVIPFGKKRRHYYITRRFNDRMAMRICSFGPWGKANKFVDHCIVNQEGDVIYTDFFKVAVEVDTVRALLMKQQIRNYFKPYEVLIRIQSVEDEIKRLMQRSYHENMQDLTQRLGLTHALAEKVTPNELRDKINEHIASGATMTIELTTLIALCHIPGYTSRYRDYKHFLERIKKVKTALRLRFSQLCTKVMYDKYIPEEAYAKYQSMVIQQIDGLRSLPIPSQAEVSGSHPGAVAPAA